jgi:uncharacterized membrane protein YphA (DoxX/SURF4 family)
VDERERVLVTLAGMRILMGVLWLALLLRAMPPSFGRHHDDGLLHTFRLAEQHAAIGPLRDLVRHLVIPHFTVFGWIVFVLELAAGISLLVGLYTRAGAWIGLSLAILFSVFVGRSPHEWRLGLVLFVAWHVVLLATPCARRLSLDDALGRDP